MYCYTDGSMWGSFSGPSTSVGGDSISHVYGYWYNYDENGEKNFVIHLLGNQDADGTVRPTDVDGGADADVFIFDTDHGAYSMEASLSYGVWGGSITRNINIYGQPYACLLYTSHRCAAEIWPAHPVPHGKQPFLLPAPSAGKWFRENFESFR